MKALILAVQSALRDALPYIKTRDIYVTEDIHLIRNAGGYPAIAIKDGGRDITPLAGDQDEEILSLTLAVSVQLLKPEAGIMGDNANPGALEIADDCINILRDNTLGGIVDTAAPVSVAPSELLLTDNLALVMVAVTMRYER